MLSESDNSFAIVDTLVSESFFLEDLTLETDIKDTTINKQEIAHMLNLVKGTYINPRSLKQGLWYLKQKNRFDLIKLGLTKAVVGYKVAIYLASRWSLYKLYIKGSLLGKDKYKRYYLLEPGEPFDLAKHQHSLVNIKKKLASAGYLNSSIRDNIDYDTIHKTIIVTLNFEQLQSYIIDEIAINLKSSEKLKEKIKHKCKDLYNSYYTHALISAKTQELKSYLTRKGYLDHEVSITYKKHHEAAKDFNITSITAAKNAINNLINLKEKYYTVRLEIVINLPHRKKFAFFGNTYLSSQSLRDQLLTIGNSALFVPPDLFAEDITDLYKSKGFWQVMVEWQEQEDRFFFIINEGPRALIKDALVELVNTNDNKNSNKNSSKNNDKSNNKDNIELQTIIAEHYKAALIDNYYDKDILKKTYYSLSEYLNKQGYTQFSLIKQKQILLFDDKQEYRLELVFDIDEDSRTKTIELINNYKNSYDSSAEDSSELSSRVRFGKTIIKGSYKLDTDIILRELAYHEGDIYDPKKVEATISKIKSLDIFETVTLKPSSQTYTTYERPMILYIVQDDPFEIRTRLGVQRTSKAFTGLGGLTYKLGGSFLWKNPLNNGDLLHVDIDFIRYKRNIGAAYDMPWIKNYPIWTTLKAYNTLYEQPFFIGSHDILYKVSQMGGALALRSQVLNGEGALTMGAQSLELIGGSPLGGAPLGGVSRLASIIDYNPALINKKNPYIFADSSWIYSSADDPFNPTRAFTSFLSLKGALSLEVANSSYLKVLYEQTHVFPVYDSLVAALRFRVGHIFGSELENIIPTERFYLGGPTTIRSYEPLGVPPLNNFCFNGHKNYWTPVGGKSMFNINAELRFPIYKALSGVIFNDMGALSNTSLADLKSHQIVGGTGLGLRYLTPLGPLRFDIAWKWSKRNEEDKSYAWYLTFGHAF